MTSAQRADIGVIGGSGFYSFFDSPERVRVDTPFGPPSDDIVIGDVDGRRVAFLARHGQGHRYPPHLVNYRANLWALRSVGVRQVLAPCAVGSLRAEHTPGTLLVPDQVVDRTRGRASTVYDEVGPVVHVSFADPYCPQARAALLTSAGDHFERTVDGGTLVVIGGPRFSSRAESQWHQAAGWSAVGMTGMPEASIARELAMCFATACLITDNDAGVEGGETVTHEEVMRVFADNIERLKVALQEAISRLPGTEPDDTATCPCRRVLDGQDLPITLPS
jgi:5'-methylthioadenosine phosphorylase